MVSWQSHTQIADEADRFHRIKHAQRDVVSFVVGH
jgi:hypothetical protein